MNIRRNRFIASAILTLGFSAFFGVLLILFADPVILQALGVVRVVLAIVLGSFALALAMTGFLVFFLRCGG